MKINFRSAKQLSALCLAASLSLLYSCGNSIPGEESKPEPVNPPVNPPDDPPAEEEDTEVMVHFGYSVDVTEEALSPQSRSRADNGGSDDLIGIAIYHVTDPDGGWIGTEPYAYGVFDDLNAMTFKLNKNRRYYINVLYYPDAKKIVYKNRDNTYGIPFNDRFASSPAYTLNSPRYNSAAPGSPGFGMMVFKNYYQNTSSDLDRDCVRGQTPIYMGFREMEVKDDSDINIRLSSCLMGIRLNCSNFNEGRLFLDYVSESSRRVTFYPGDDLIDRVQIVSPYEESENFSGYGNRFGGSESIRLYYQPNDEQTYLIATKVLSWKPNTTYVFNFDLEKRADGSFGIIVPGETDYVEEYTQFD